jgi:hypothetical protein
MLKTEALKLFTMVINRKLAMIIIVVAVLVAAGVFLPLAWLSSLPWTPFATEDIRITEVQFDEGYLNITVKNVCTNVEIVSEVTVRDLEAYGYGFTVDWTSTPHVVAVHEEVPVGKEISFRISFKWTSGRAYQIELEPEDKGWGTVINVVAQ